MKPCVVMPARAGAEPLKLGPRLRGGDGIFEATACWPVIRGGDGIFEATACWPVIRGGDGIIEAAAC